MRRVHRGMSSMVNWFAPFFTTNRRFAGASPGNGEFASSLPTNTACSPTTAPRLPSVIKANVPSADVNPVALLAPPEVAVPTGVNVTRQSAIGRPLNVTLPEVVAKSKPAAPPHPPHAKPMAIVQAKWVP
jgi:hypothetical protein